MSVRTAAFRLPPLSLPAAPPRRLHCGTDVDPARTSLIRAKVNARLARGEVNLLPAEPVVIPVHAHVINKGQGLENGDVPTDVVQAQVDQLNRGCAGTGLQFRLDSVDRTTNASWYELSSEAPEYEQMKAALHQGGLDELNLYIAKPHDDDGELLGIASFPWEAELNPSVDGVLIHNKTLPGIGYPESNEGDTAIHEVGHWAGLWHTFENGCGQPGDEVDDTPSQREPGWGTPEHQDSCPAPGEDPVHNYMDYGDDQNAREFTPGQVARMRAHYDVYRRGGGGQIVRANAAPDAPVLDAQSATSTLTVDRNLPFQSLKLNLTVADDDASDAELPEGDARKGEAHDSPGDLVISLRSPSGREVVVVDRQQGIELLDVSYEIAALFPGEPTQGDWTLTVQDTDPNGHQGRLSSWSLIFGAAKA